MPKIAPFDLHTELYETWFEVNKIVYESEIAAIKKLIPFSGSGIEIGVGSGRFAEPLGIKFGIEPSRNMRKLAKSKGIKVIDAAAEDIPLQDSSFEFAMMITTVCFLDNIEKAFKEAYRIIKENGSLIIGFVDKESPLGKFYEKHKEQSAFYREAVFYSVSEIIHYMEIAGFINFNYCQTIFKPLKEIKKIEPVKDGYGEGSFVVIKGYKI
ncbi:MAG: methyltransferase type 11 [Spirochaetes bacterium GWF1_41_5]|nr:MAG: methyltransferase type 11 [Spirochaetes bacterium GWF1_41_5]HBE04360.1 SAM-dependent methyltransferase [Spirochaetia bacterium]